MKYKVLSKEKKAALRKEFLETENAFIYRKANRIFNVAIFGLIIAVVAGIFNIYHQTGILNYLLDGMLFLFTAFAIFKTSRVKQYELNKYINQKNNNSKKK